MYTVGLDVDTRAYFTAATCAISFNKTLSINTPLSFFHGIFYKKYSTNNNNCNPTNSKKLTMWNKPLGFSSMNSKSQITVIERNMLQLTPRVKVLLLV